MRGNQEKLNMKMKLEGAEMPLAVKFTDGGAKRKRQDFDSPKKDGDKLNKARN